MAQTLSSPCGFLLAACLLTACGDTGSRADNRPSKAAVRVDQIVREIGQSELRQSPETASRLGLSIDKTGYNYTNLLDDRSQAAFERRRLVRLEASARFENIDATTLPEPSRTNFLVTQSALRGMIGMSKFGHGQVSFGYSRPYAADQLSGAYIDLLDLLLNRQNVRSEAEAWAYIDRLGQLASAMDDDRRRLIAEASAGIGPPDFIFERMIQLSAELSAPNENGIHPLMETFSNLSENIGDLPPETRQKMMQVVNRTVSLEILPAYQRFADTLGTLAGDAREAPGVWAIPNGDDYYRAALQFYTGQIDIDPAKLHEDGLSIVEAINTELNFALQEAGYSEGTILERLALINQSPEQIFPNNEAGRRALLELLETHLDRARQLSAALITNPPDTNIVISPVPDILSSNAPGGYYSPASANGSAPATFYINLRDTSEWPAYSLPTLLYHEALPGHHLESALIAEQRGLSITRQLIWLPVYGEGWALYAEDLANEHGAYTDDPLGKVGYLQSILFRAARLVADTGLHYQRWSRQRAVTYLAETTGQSVSAMETEIDRYTVWPGQAITYMTGRQFIWSLRQRAQNELGTDFNLAAFHQMILANGPRPLSLIETDFERWIAAQKQ